MSVSPSCPDGVLAAPTAIWWSSSAGSFMYMTRSFNPWLFKEKRKGGEKRKKKKRRKEKKRQKEEEKKKGKRNKPKNPTPPSFSPGLAEVAGQLWRLNQTLLSVLESGKARDT